ncbi:MAG: hypothetical protein K9G41_00975 [Flavobacteriales bacterium]|nr:hypothetical protein [Flavobacteriales bacterium]
MVSRLTPNVKGIYLSQHVDKIPWLVFLFAAPISYFFGYFESHVDLVNHSMTESLWFEQTKSPLWNATGFLVPCLDNALNATFGEYDFYALFMVSINSAVLSFLIWSLLKLASKLDISTGYFIAICSWLIVAAPQILTINSTRIAITGTFAVLLYLGSKDNWRGMLCITKAFLLFLFLAILSLVRMEAVVLIGAYVGFPLFIYNRWSYKFLSPVIIGLAIMIGYNLSLEARAPEAMKVFYYYENELIDRGNVCVENAYTRGLLDDKTLVLKNSEDSLSMQTTTLIYHSLPDIGLLKTSFVENTLCSGKLKPLVHLFLGGINLDSWRSCFTLSIEESKRGLWVMIASLLLLVFLSFAHGFDRFTLSAFLMFLLPVLLLFHITVPDRFLIPYYTCFISIYLILSCLKQPRVGPISILFSLLIASFLIVEQGLCIKEKQAKEKLIANYIAGVRKIVKEEKRFVVLQTNSPELFMPQRVQQNYSPIDSVLFMDEYFTYKTFYETWRATCNCNPASITDRLEFAAITKAAYISTESGVHFSSKYAHLMHKFPVKFIPKSNFGNALTRYQVQISQQ